MSRWPFDNDVGPRAAKYKQFFSSSARLTPSLGSQKTNTSCKWHIGSTALRHRNMMTGVVWNIDRAIITLLEDLNLEAHGFLQSFNVYICIILWKLK